MKHYGQKEVIFKHANGKDPIGLVFQVTDVKKPLLAVRRLVEKGNKVVLSGVEGGELYLERGHEGEGAGEEEGRLVRD